MRDSKILFHEKTAPTAVSNIVDTGGSEPGVGRMAMIGATYDLEGGTAPAGSVTMTLATSDDPAMAGAVNAATFSIPAEHVAQGGCILSTKIPETAKRYLQTTWSGLTGGLITDGIDWGLRSGTPAKVPYLY